MSRCRGKENAVLVSRCCRHLFPLPRKKNATRQPPLSVVTVPSPVVAVEKFIRSSQVAAALDGFQNEVAAGHDAATDSIKQACTAARQCLFCVNSCVRPLIFSILFNVVRRVIVLSCGGRGLPDHVFGDNWMTSLQKTMIFFMCAAARILHKFSSKKQRHAGSVPGHAVIHRDREGGHQRMYQDYLANNPTYGPDLFRRRLLFFHIR